MLSDQAFWYPDGRRKRFTTYIMSNASMTLYTGVTNDLIRRMGEHRGGEGEFTSRYHITRLVYFETYDRITDAIAREKRIKNMSRANKIALIKSVNPSWRDLALEL